MLVIMIKDSNLMCHDFNLLDFSHYCETHWRRVNRGEVGFVIMKRKWAEAPYLRRH
jgi:hypothetical protein